MGDGGSDSYDWALLMPLDGNGNGDFSDMVWAFGGEDETNNGYSGTVTISPICPGAFVHSLKMKFWVCMH